MARFIVHPDGFIEGPENFTPPQSAIDAYVEIMIDVCLRNMPEIIKLSNLSKVS